MISGQNKRIVFFGNERLVSGLESTDAPILSGLIESGYTIVAVVSHHSESKSRNQRPLEVATIAEKHNIPLYLPDKPSEITFELSELKPDIAVLVAYGRIINQTVIDIFPDGIINIHPSLLPQYRGPTPIESVILNGDSKTGVSIMKLSAGMDDGPVYAQRPIEGVGDNDKNSLYKKVSATSTDLFFDIFPQILNGTLQPTNQLDEEATYSKLIQKSDGVVDWMKPAAQLEREVRAYTGWPQSRAKLGSIDTIITKAHVVPISDGEPGHITITDENGMVNLMVNTTEGYLCIDEIKPLGKKEMPISAFLSGYRSQLGI
jgi:methionyl-tRNA formyltransferase